MNILNELTNIINQKFGGCAVEAPVNLGDFVYSAGKASEALLYSILFMPEFILVDDSILLAWSISDELSKKRFLDALYGGSKSRAELESSFNFIEVAYLFDTRGRDTTDQEDRVLAELIRNAWDGWLKVSYPSRRFKVEVLSMDITGSTVGVHFYEIR